MEDKKQTSEKEVELSQQTTDELEKEELEEPFPVTTDNDDDDDSEEEESYKNKSPPPTSVLLEEVEPFPVRMIPYNYYYSTTDDDDDSEEEESYKNKSPPPTSILLEEVEPFPVRMIPYNYYYSTTDDDSTSDEKEESQCDKKNSTVPEQDQTPGRLDLDLDSHSKIQAIPGPNIPTSSILVKHGTKRPADVGDEDSKRLEKMALLKSTDYKNQNK